MQLKYIGSQQQTFWFITFAFGLNNYKFSFLMNIDGFNLRMMAISLRQLNWAEVRSHFTKTNINKKKKAILIHRYHNSCSIRRSSTHGCNGDFFEAQPDLTFPFVIVRNVACPEVEPACWEMLHHQTSVFWHARAIRT